MAKVSEEISKYNANSGGRTDANIANDALHLGGVKAEDYATKKYVQDYHGTKDAELKEYIDGQDEAKLQEAKAYADQAVNNQDFSGFAKVTDVQAVDEKLTKKIEECGHHCAENLNTQIQAVVNDTNANFQDVNSAIGQLNANQNNLFQSVSSGKAKVAAAITDKGVTTASDASYDTMAGNIRNIKTGGGELAPGFVNTSDANATSADLLVGKTAYAQGQKIYGTLIQQPGETGMPTYGTDTSNSTATSGDIAYGKTAYARGELLIGTMPSNKEVEEIYGIDDSGYGLESQVAISTKDTITGDTITERTLLTFSKELDYCVSMTKLNNTSTCYIESYAVNDKGMYIQQSTSMSGEIGTKKYRYTKSELGIEDEETIIQIKLGTPGIDDDIHKCYLFIITRIKNNEQSTSSKTYNDYKLHIYTYHLSENGTIGKMYNNENVINLVETISTISGYSVSYGIVNFNNKVDQFYVLEHRYASGADARVYIYNYKVLNNNLIKISSLTNNGSYSTNVAEIKVSNNDEYVSISSRGSSNNAIVIKNDITQIDYMPSDSQRPGEAVFINDTDYYIFGIANTLNLRKWGSSDYKKLVGTTQSIANLHITPTNDKLIVLTEDSTIHIYNIEGVSNIENGITLTEEKVYSLGMSSLRGTTTCIYRNSAGNKFLLYIPGYKNLHKLETGLDTNNIMGIKYKNQYFYNIKNYLLTAVQEDVKVGKTFIGNGGMPQTGTMEV